MILKRIAQLSALGVLMACASCNNDKEALQKLETLTKQYESLQDEITVLKSQEEDKSKTSLDATGIAIVDLEKLLKDYKGYTDASKKLEYKLKNWESELKQEQEKLQTDYAAAERSAQFLKEEQIQAKGTELQNRYNDLMMKQQDYAKQAEVAESALTKEVLQKVNTHLKAYAEQNGYKMILFTAVENGIFYAQEEINITDEYIADLNEAYSKGFK